MNSQYEKGIDVSKWQGTIDWKKVADSGVKHVFIKMSEGGTYTDPKFKENFKNAKNAGIQANCYHYFRAVSSTPQQQFENIKKNLSSAGFDPSKNSLAIDVESKNNQGATPEVMADNLHVLLNLISKDEVLSCQDTFIYCSPAYWDSGVKWDKYDFSIYPLWIANWNVETPRIPLSWKNAGKSWTWWQYSSKGTVEGITENVVDLDWVKTV
ncbi:glycoside hydrolase family 25 protein [Candidatus Arsenophonus triatominarum]|uniref:glycoside hydrolase family 25 protein n=1 Tax=Candidatus Arsenophonus triatominarum TaxID=57911 RepID=UPI0007C59666|nr:glycoside hydrolase family 25 protein [Candidatus Arsenophonus triatominarum]